MSVQRFKDAQDPVTLRIIYDELQRGKKLSHWIWFIFPQGPREGTSEKSQYYALTDEEASEYLFDLTLSSRLLNHTRLVIDWMKRGKSVEEILGEVDALKFRSSMELFARMAIWPEDKATFEEALELTGPPHD